MGPRIIRHPGWDSFFCPTSYVQLRPSVYGPIGHNNKFLIFEIWASFETRAYHHITQCLAILWYESLMHLRPVLLFFTMYGFLTARCFSNPVLPFFGGLCNMGLRFATPLGVGCAFVFPVSINFPIINSQIFAGTSNFDCSVVDDAGCYCHPLGS